MKATLHGDVERYRRRQAPKRLREKGGRRSDELVMVGARGVGPTLYE